jgi:hypothetical protein
MAAKPKARHHPGTPAPDEPPQALLDALEQLRDPLVTQAGLTTTADGRWALCVTVPPRTSTPLARIEKKARGFPVIYLAAPDELPIARPAYPGRGE